MIGFKLPDGLSGIIQNNLESPTEDHHHQQYWMILETRLVIRNIRDIRNGRTPRSCPPPTCSSALGKCNSSQSLCPGSATKHDFPELSSNISPGCNEDNRGFHNPVSSIWQSGWDQLSSPELKITNDLVSIYYFYDKKCFSPISKLL